MEHDDIDLLTRAAAQLPDLSGELLALAERLRWDFVGKDDAARLLGCNPKTLERLRDAGKIRSYQVAGKGPLRFRRSDLARLMTRTGGTE